MNKEERRRYDWQRAKLLEAHRIIDDEERTRRQLGGVWPALDDTTLWCVFGMKNDLERILRENNYEAPGQKSEAA